MDVIGISPIVDTSHTETHTIFLPHIYLLFCTNKARYIREFQRNPKKLQFHRGGSPSIFSSRTLTKISLPRWMKSRVVKRRKTERDDCKVERANRFRFIVRWSSTGGSRSAEKAAKGDGAMEGSIRWIELFKGRARTGAFYECPAQWRLCGPVRVAYTCCVHALTYIVGGRRHRHHRECANNEGKFVPRSH